MANSRPVTRLFLAASFSIVLAVPFSSGNARADDLDSKVMSKVERDTRADGPKARSSAKGGHSGHRATSLPSDSGGAANARVKGSSASTLAAGAGFGKANAKTVAKAKKLDKKKLDTHKTSGGHSSRHRL